MEDKTSEISDAVINLEPIQINVNGKSKRRKSSMSDTVFNCKSEVGFVDQGLYFHPHSSSQLSNQQSAAPKQGLSNKSIDKSCIQSSTSADGVKINNSKERSSDQVYKVNVRKLNRKKFAQQTFQFKRVEIYNDKTLVQFETSNPFKLLGIMNEDYLERTVSKVNLKSVPKCSLKKCRYCNYKKRSCGISSSSCVARIKKCFKCGKRGHYPQSMCCKANKTSQSHKKRSLILNPSSCKALQGVCFKCDKARHFPKSVDCIAKDKSKKIKRNKLKEKANAIKISKGAINLIKERIYQLEFRPLKEEFPQNFTSEKVPAELIPFLTMFILFNFDLIYHQKQGSQSMKDDHSILKSAEHCARKFIHIDHQRNDCFIKYCIEKGKTVIKDEPMPTKEKMISMQSTLDVFDQMYYSLGNKGETDREDQSRSDQIIPQFDTSYDLDSSDYNSSHYEEIIPQFDGGCDLESSDDDEIINKSVFAINCEINNISCLINFFRGFEFLWSASSGHCLCIPDHKQPEQNCFFCNLRSSCLRLSVKRTKGPKNLKLVEFISQLVHYQDLDWNWRSDGDDLVGFIEKIH